MRSSDSSFLNAKVPPVAWTAGGFLLQRLFPARRPSAWMRAASLLVFAGSAALGTRAVRGFLDTGTTFDPHCVAGATSLVTDGAHSVSRNPMYTALLGALVGRALWRGRLAALLPVAGAWAALDRFQVRPEEKALKATFGKEFKRYTKAVPRWL